MEDIKFEDLTEGQRLAHDGVMDIIEGREVKTHILIKGEAGCGKSLLTKFLLDSIIKTGIRGIILTAPTHQAKNVLANMAGKEANTIHSILRIKPDTYEDVKIFEQADVPKLDDCEILICDEASMYDDKLFSILMRSIPSRCIIIAIGDEEQIRAVDPYGSKKSPIFKDKRFKTFSLTEVKRATGPILELARHIRSGGWTGAADLENQERDGESIMVVDDPKKILLEYLKNVKTPEDFKNNRILAYTNKLVDSCNKVIRKKIYGKDVPDFVKDELIVMQEPVTKKISIGGVMLDETLFNNSERVKILSCDNTSDFFGLPGVPGKIMIRYWELKVKSDEQDNNIVSTIKVITDEDEKTKLQDLLNNAAIVYKDRSSGHRPNWKEFWKLKGNFKSVKYLPSCTFHKSQGASIDNCYVFASQVDSNDHLNEEEKRELLYVGTSRARKKLYIY